MRRIMSRHPALTGAMTGFWVMCVGDTAAQLTIEQGCGRSWRDFDLIRNVTSSIFQAGGGFFMGKWWNFLDSKLPGVSGIKLVVNQIVLTGSITPAYMLWSGIVEAPLRGSEVDLAALSARLSSELPTLLPTSFCFWLPFHVVNFALIPAHLRVAFISSVSVAWGGYLSYVSHGRGKRDAQS